MSILYAGVDISKSGFTCSLWINQATVDLSEFTNDQDGFKALAAAIAPYYTANQYETVQIIMEATGGYELRLLSFIVKQSWTFTLPNPKRVRDWAKGMGYRAKNDRIDGRLLAHFGYQTRPEPQQPVPQVIEQLDSLLQRQEDIEKLLRQERNRQHALAYHPDASPAAVESVACTIAFLERQKQQIEEAIKALLKANPELHAQAQQLSTVCGVGKKNNLASFGHMPPLLCPNQWERNKQGDDSLSGA